MLVLGKRARAHTQPSVKVEHLLVSLEALSNLSIVFLGRLST